MWKDVDRNEALDALRQGKRVRNPSRTLELSLGNGNYVGTVHAERGQYCGNWCPTRQELFNHDAVWQIWVDPPSEKERLDDAYSLLKDFTGSVSGGFQEWIDREKQIREECND